jgi:HEAT repeat protein
MRIRSATFTIAMAFAVVASTLCQVSPSVRRGGPRSTNELLVEHHVKLTTESLVRALKSSDAEVRYLAAEKLAEDGVKDAIPSITEALSAEKVPGSRVNIAFALAQLGENKGAAALESECNNDNVPGYVRMRAVRYLLDMHMSGCLNAVLNLAESKVDPDSRIQAISLLPSFQHSSKEDSQRIFDVLVGALRDPTPAVRLEGSVALGAFGNTSAVPYLEGAINSEEDEVVRGQMQGSLEVLRRQVNHHD